MTRQEYINQQALIELARREFFFYCHLLAPDFYRPERKYLVEMCEDLQNFTESDEEVLVINVGPRHGKSRTAQMFTSWLMGRDKNIKVMTGSYNETLSTMFSKNVRNQIQEVKADDSKPVFSDIFPDVRIKHGDGAMNLWSLEGGYNNYLATSPGGTATGFGADYILVDDLIKNAEEAYNSQVLEKHWDWFTNTMLSRLETGGKLIIIMTRWATKDLAGRILSWCKAENKKYRHINLKTYLGNGEMLAPDILSYRDYKAKISAMSEEIVSANYQQEPVDIKGRLYSSLKTYDTLPFDIKTKQIQAYTDTADTGKDFLCMIIYVVHEGLIYILDIFYTQESMEFTEPESAARHEKFEVSYSVIESNNGGRGFGRNVERILEENLNYQGCKFKLFHQSKNKIARILSQATNVMNLVHFPADWDFKYPDFYRDVTEYQRTGKNEHDDACFVGGTKIATLWGDRNIEDIKAGDFVITPFGVRKVLSAGCTGEKEVITNIGLTGTPNHKVFSKISGFKPLDRFTGTAENDILSLKGWLNWKYRKLLCSMELNTDLWGRENIILVSHVQMKDEDMLKDFMWQFGNIIMAGEYQKVIRFTIKMVILLITTLAIWSWYRLNNIWRNIAKKTWKILNSGCELLTLSRNTVIKLPNGTEVQREEHGIVSTLRKCKEKLSLKTVKSVGQNMRLNSQIQDSVQINVEKDGEVGTGDLNIQQNVLYAEQSSQLLNTNHQRQKEKPVQRLVQIDSTTGTEKRKVYNLTVEKDHVYYAHGLLVSNCDTLTGVCENMTKGGARFEFLR